MTYPPQPGNWSDPSWPQQQQQPQQPPYNDPYSGPPADPYSGAPAGYGTAPASPAAYPSYGYGAPPPQSQSTNGLAIASLVCSLVGIATCGVVAIVGAILGHVARKQIRERGEGGAGMALAGIIVGWVVFVGYTIFWIAYIVFVVWLVQNPDAFPTPRPS